MVRTTVRIWTGILAATLVTVTACGSSNQPSGSGGSSPSIKLAGVFADTSDPFWATVGCGAQQEAAKRGVDLKLYAGTTPDTQQLASNYASAQLFNPNGELVIPFDTNQFVTQIGQLMKSGVPVVTATATTPSEQYQVVFSAPDTSPYLSSVLGLLGSQSGSMVLLGGAPGIPPLEARYKPLIAAVQQAEPGLHQLPIEYTGFDINKTTSIVSSLLIAHPDLSLIVASSGPEGQGAAAALTQAGAAGRVKLIAFDAVPPEVTALKQGTITALIAQSPSRIGATAVDSLVDYLKAHPSKTPVNPDSKPPQLIPQRLLTKDNVDNPANQDYVYKASC